MSLTLSPFAPRMWRNRETIEGLLEIHVSFAERTTTVASNAANFCYQPERISVAENYGVSATLKRLSRISYLAFDTASLVCFAAF